MNETITLTTGLVQAQLHVDGVYELDIDGKVVTDYYCSICARTPFGCDGEGNCVHKRLLRAAVKKYEGVPELVVIGNRCLCGNLKDPDAEWCEDCQEEVGLIDFVEWHPCMPDPDAYREWRQTLFRWVVPE